MKDFQANSWQVDITNEIILYLKAMARSPDQFTPYRKENMSSLIRLLNQIDSLDLSWKQLRSEEVKVLGQALSHNFTITTLNLNTNNFTDEGVIGLVDGLVFNSKLKKLYLGNNKLGDQAAKRVAALLQLNNSPLKELFLHDNYIGNEGARAIADALQFNKHLTSLNLEFNSITTANDFAQALYTNQKLQWLSLAGNRIKDEGAHALTKAVSHNGTLLNLDVGANALIHEGAPLIKAIYDKSRFKKPLSHFLLGRVLGKKEGLPLAIVKLIASFSSVDPKLHADMTVGFWQGSKQERSEEITKALSLLFYRRPYSTQFSQISESVAGTVIKRKH